MTHGDYVIYYFVDRHEIVVRAVVHGARQFQPGWLGREE
jgi:plasmid stabilization system protein ParE